MIGENIKQYRTARGMSQEELATRCHVVRQTVSKWENGRSVPDADAVVRLAEVLGVSVSDLLGLAVDTSRALSDELARVNAALAAQREQMQLAARAEGKRNVILFLTFAALLAALAVNRPVVSLALCGGCLLAALVVLYRNLTLLTIENDDIRKMRALRLTTVVNIVLVVAAVFVALGMESGVLRMSANQEKLGAMGLIAAVMVFFGVMAPRLPFSRHTGLRLPWTVRDEDTWKVAHRILGWMSLPLAVLYVACALTLDDFDAVTITAVLLWIGIPGGLSALFYWQKYSGRL